MDRRIATGAHALPRRTLQTELPPGETERLLALVAYVPVICLVPYILDDGSNPYVQYHARQGVALFFIALLAGSLFFIPSVGTYVAPAALLLDALAALFCLYHAAGGRCRRPFTGGGPAPKPGRR